MPAKYTKWTNIWKNLTPLDSSQLEVFLEILGIFFIFLIQIWILNLGRFETGRYRNRSGPVWPVTAVSGPVPVGKENPDLTSIRYILLLDVRHINMAPMQYTYLIYNYFS